MKKIISTFVLLALFTFVYAEVHKGSCGQNLKWRLDTETGILDITGSGDMYDYSYFYTYSPWREKELNYDIKTISLPNGLTHIGAASFVYCLYATTVNIPDNVTSIGNCAFAHCNDLVNLTMGTGLQSIGAQAFDGCRNLTSITIPNGVHQIGSEAFLNCVKLNAVYITDLSQWCNIDFPNNYSNPLTYAQNLYLNGTQIFDLIIPEDVKRIGLAAFYNCRSFTSISIPKNVEYIGPSCFYKCFGLTKISCAAIEPPTLGSTVFDEVDKSTPLYVPLESIEKYKSADQWKDFYNIHSIEEVEGIDGITASSFNQNNKLIQNGQILIKRGEKTYTLTGAETK